MDQSIPEIVYLILNKEALVDAPAQDTSTSASIFNFDVRMFGYYPASLVIFVLMLSANCERKLQTLLIRR